MGAGARRRIRPGSDQAEVQGIRAEFKMLKASGRDASWDAMLNGLHRLHNREDRTVEWELEATVHVKKSVNAKAQE